MLNVAPLSAALGAEVSGVDLSDDLDDETLRALLDAFFAHQVMIVPGQRLAPSDFARLARAFGRPQPHVLSHLRHAEHPEILPLTNVLKDGEPTGIYDGAAYWHADMSYEAEPGAATLVYSIAVPEAGGETCFADMYGAYEALPEATKQRIEGLTLRHHYGNRFDLDESSRRSAAALTAEQKKTVEDVFHPLVRCHPVTGRKALYAVCGTSFGIVGWPDDEALGLLDELAAHATQDRFVYRHRYSVGEVVAWDNAATLHAATLIPPATGPSDTRLLHRVSLKGLPPLLQ